MARSLWHAGALVATAQFLLLGVEAWRSLRPFPRGSFTLRTPAFLDCTGPGWPPVWDEWHDLVERWEEALAATVYHSRQPHSSPEMANLAEQVTSMAHKLLEEWFRHVSKINGSGLDRVIWGRLPPESLSGTCYYGLLHCLWVRAQALFWRPDRTVFEHGEAMMELRTALEMLGQDFRSDYIDSTRWPVRGLDLAQSLRWEMISKVPRFKHVVNRPPVFAAVQAAAAPLGRDFFAESAAMELSPLPRRELVMAAFGSHAALVSEPVTMLDLALPEWRIATHWILSPCRRMDPLHHYQCRLKCLLLGECVFLDDRSNHGQRILGLVELVAEGVRRDESIGEPLELPALMDLTAELWQTDSNLARADLAVCTVPLICSLLRAVAHVPLLGYFAMTHYMDAAHGLGEWGMMHFAAMASNPSKNAFAVLSHLWSHLGALQLGVRLPVVRPFCLYFFRNYSKFDMPNPFQRVSRSSGFYDHTILVPRSWLVMETSFLHMFNAFVDLIKPVFPFSFLVVRSAKPSAIRDVNSAENPSPHGERLADALREDRNIFIDPTRMQQFRAAIFLPQMPQQLTFYELHSMHVPVYIPGCAWLYRLHHQRRWSFFYDQRGRKGAEGVGRQMKPPLFNEYALVAEDGLQHWVLLYELRYAMDLPGVTGFDSFPELLEALLYSDMEEIRERMRQDNEAAFQPVMRWYRYSATALLEGTIGQ